MSRKDRKSVVTKLPNEVWSEIQEHVGTGRGKSFPSVSNFLLVAACQLLERLRQEAG